MLEATPRNLVSWNFTVRRAGAAVAEIQMSWFREQASATIGTDVYELSREGLLRGAFVMRSGDQTVARARKVSAIRRGFEVDWGAGRTFELKALAPIKRRLGLFDAGTQVGAIRPASPLRRKAVIDLPDSLPVPVQVFLLWLVLILWRRAAGSGRTSR